VCDRAVIYYGGSIQQYGTLEELLTERDTVRFTVPALSADAQKEVMDVIAKHVSKDEVRVDNPTQNLESFFLNVVETAISKDETTSGATSGHEVAEFLKADQPVQTQADKMLDRLADKEATAPTPKVDKEPEPAKPKVDEAKLDALTEKTEPAKPKADTKPAASQKDQLDKADDKLSDLLGD